MTTGRAAWKGTVSFGLVSVPVKLYAATQDHGVRLHQSHQGCTARGVKATHRISYVRVCKDCGGEVDFGSVGSVFEDVDRTTVTLSKNEVDRLSAGMDSTIGLSMFVDPAEVDPLRWGKTYYVRPDFGDADKPRPNPQFELLVEALRRTGKAAVGRVVLRTRESLVALTAHEGGLVARTILWADELRPPAVDTRAAPVVQVSDAEVAMAVQLVETMTKPFNIEDHVDRREQALTTLIESRRPVPVPASDRVAMVHDLTARLREDMAVHAV